MILRRTITTTGKTLIATIQRTTIILTNINLTYTKRTKLTERIKLTKRTNPNLTIKPPLHTNLSTKNQHRSRKKSVIFKDA